MLGISVKKINSDIIIKWQLSTFTIPISHILSITTDDTYAGEEKQAIRIGSPYPQTDRIVIKTKKDTYVLFTSNVITIQNKLTSYVNEYNTERNS